MYKVEREYDGSKKEIAEVALYDEAVRLATEEGNSNTSSYYAIVRIYNDGVAIWVKNFPPGWTSEYKGD